MEKEKMKKILEEKFMELISLTPNYPWEHEYTGCFQGGSLFIKKWADNITIYWNKATCPCDLSLLGRPCDREDIGGCGYTNPEICLGKWGNEITFYYRHNPLLIGSLIFTNYYLWGDISYNAIKAVKTAINLCENGKEYGD